MKKLTKEQYREIFKQPESSAPAMARTLDKFFKFSFYGIIGVGLFMIAFAMIAFVSGEFTAPTALNTGLMNLTVTENLLPTQEASMVCMILEYSTILLPFAPVCMGIFVIRTKILYPIQKGKPLPPISQDLKKLGIQALIFCGLSSVSKYLYESLSITSFDVENLLLSDKITEITYNVSLDLTFLIIFLVLYFLSFVFRYMENTKRQAEDAASVK